MDLSPFGPAQTGCKIEAIMWTLPPCAVDVEVMMIGTLQDILCHVYYRLVLIRLYVASFC